MDVRTTDDGMTNRTTEDTAPDTRTEDTVTNRNYGAHVCIENGVRDLLFVSVTSMVEPL